MLIGIAILTVIIQRVPLLPFLSTTSMPTVFICHFAYGYSHDIMNARVFIHRSAEIYSKSKERAKARRLAIQIGVFLSPPQEV